MKDYSSMMGHKLHNCYKGEAGISKAGYLAIGGVAVIVTLAAMYIGITSIEPELKLTQTQTLPPETTTVPEPVDTPTPTPMLKTVEVQTLETNLTATYSNLRKNEGSPPLGFQSGNWWYFDVTIKNESNVRVTIEKRQKKLLTVDWYKAEPEKMDIVDIFGTDNIDAGASITSKPGTQWVWFYTWTYPYTLTETFFGKDGNGQEVKISYSFEVISD